MRLHHIGIVVEDLTSYGESYRTRLGMREESRIFEDPIQKVRIQFWGDGLGPLVELIEPCGSDSPVDKALQKGGGLNHLCYEVEDLDKQVQLSIEQGALPATAITPAVAFEGRRVAFLFFPQLNLIEFVEAPST